MCDMMELCGIILFSHMSDQQTYIDPVDPTDHQHRLRVAAIL